MYKSIAIIGGVALTFSNPLVAAVVLPQSAVYTTATDGAWYNGTGSVYPVGQYSISLDGNGVDVVASAESSPGTLVSSATGGLAGVQSYSYSATSSFTGNYINGAVSSDYSLNFLIGSGYVYAGLLNIIQGASNQYAQASYSLSILLNGTEIWGSNLLLKTQVCATGGFCTSREMWGGEHPLGATSTPSTPAATYSSIGFNIPNLAPMDSFNGGFYGYSWTEKQLNLDLGVMDPFEAFSLEYVMTAKVSGYADNSDGARTGALISDPFGVDGGFGRLNATAIASVPEPPMLALLGLWLLGMVPLLRRK